LKDGFVYRRDPLFVAAVTGKDPLFVAAVTGKDPLFVAGVAAAGDEEHSLENRIEEESALPDVTPETVTEKPKGKISRLIAGKVAF